MIHTKAFSYHMLKALKQERSIDPTVALALPAAVLFPLVLMWLVIGNHQSERIGR